MVETQQENAPEGRTPVSRPDAHLSEDFDPVALAKEEARLRDLAKRPLPQRLGGYVSLSGPGWLQAALTLGGGSAASSLAAGYLFGYKLLWVQPLAMLCGVIMTSAMAYMMCSTRDRPMAAVSTFAHPALAWGWAAATLLSSVIWCLPQFNLAASVMSDWSGMSGGEPRPTSDPLWLLPCFLIIAFTTFLTWNYGRSIFWVRFCELLLKFMVAAIILCFVFVVLMTPTDWLAVLKGFFGFYIPKLHEDYSVPIAAFATAVGINMTFLFPCSLRARGWGKPHRGLARFDIWTGMLIPYVLATSMIIIATANVFPDGGTGGLNAQMLATSLEPVAGPFFAHIVFGLGILAMTISSIAMLQLVSGFVLMEVFKVSRRSWWFRLGSLAPAVGFLGPMIWGHLDFYLVMPTSVICFFMLPIAYISFLILMNSKAFLGAERPEGWRRKAWNISMIIVVCIVLAASVFSAWRSILKFGDALERRRATVNVAVVGGVAGSGAPSASSANRVDFPTPPPVTPAPTPFVDASGRRVLFDDDFSAGIARHWEPTDPEAWAVMVDGAEPVYALVKLSEYEPPHRSPLSYSLVRDVTPGDFEMAVTLKSTGRDGDPHRDLCLFFGYQDPGRYYYVHLGAAADENSHGVFIVNGEARRNITVTKTEGVVWDDAYHEVRLVRRGSAIAVYWDGDEDPILTATDATFGQGRIGVGSFDNSGHFSRVAVFAAI